MRELEIYCQLCRAYTFTRRQSCTELCKKEICLLKRTLVLMQHLLSVFEISLSFSRTTVTLSSHSLPLSSSCLTSSNWALHLTPGTQLPRKELYRPLGLDLRFMAKIVITIISNDTEIPIVIHSYLPIWRTYALIKPFKNKDVELVELKKILIKPLNGNSFSDCLCYLFKQ